jgi:amidase
LFGNPQVGPFFVVGAQPGDTLAITLTSLKLNRDYADSLDGVVGRLKTRVLRPKVLGWATPFDGSWTASRVLHVRRGQPVR